MKKIIKNFVNRRVTSIAMVHIMNRRPGSLAMINKITKTISVALDKEVYGVPMIELIGMRILCYILIAVMIAKILE